MSATILSVEKLGKKYRIKHQVERRRYTALRDVIAQALASTFHKLVDQRKKAETGPPASEDFWAVKDVSFQIEKGEVVGVIGRNGAGKSTLLKLLSRITEPTAGRVRIKGRVSSLLEVGTGFHPELTGRENIYLNGAILGMQRAEIKLKFDEIVAFAEVEKFLDTPVKRYSSGMYVRLAFAVAAHLEPEILIVDEVLAVGDAQFQKKCLGKMQEVADKEGRTILFVSHQMAAVNRLCTKALVMEAGQVAFIGETAKAVALYTGGQNKTDVSAANLQRRPGTGEMRYVSIVTSQDFYAVAEKKTIRFKIQQQKPTHEPFFISGLLRQDDVHIFQYDSRMLDFWLAPQGEITGSISFDHPWLKPGDYSVDLYICSAYGIMDEILGGASITVVENMPYHGAFDSGAFRYGVVLPQFSVESQTPSLAHK